jgi:hypothetical protein
VIASVLAITKLPTKSAMPPNASRIVRKMPIPSLLSLLSAAAWAVAVWTSVVSESSGLIWSASSTSETPGFAPTRIRSSLPCLSNSWWAVGMSKTAIVVPASESSSPKRTMPVISYLRTGPSANAPIVSPTAKCSLSAVDLSMAI